MSCHVPTVGWTITPGQLQMVFEQTDGGAYDDGLGLSAVFRTVDGANSPNADVSTVARRRAAYSMLLDRGLVRVGLAIPATAEFELVAVDDPYHFASAAELSLFRRPLPTTNLKFDSTVMWDGREVAPGATVAYGYSAKGGPDEILAQAFYIGINDNFGDSKTGAAFSPMAFDLYDPWRETVASDGTTRPDPERTDGDRDGDRDGPRGEQARAAIARGQALFNTKPIATSGVSGINDEAAFGKPAMVMGTCSTCHDTPNGGNHSVVAPLNIGLTDASRRTPDMPLYTLRTSTTGSPPTSTPSSSSTTRASTSGSPARTSRTSWRSSVRCSPPPATRRSDLDHR